MRVVVALGGNALLRRDQPMTAAHQRANVRVAARALAPLAREHELIVTHGNGPQVGLLALQAAAYEAVEPYPLDVLDAESEGMIGYLIEQELANALALAVPLATLLTMVEVDPADPAFDHPSKPIGPIYAEAVAKRLAADRGWSLAPDGAGWRRVVPSPRPLRVVELRPIRWLIERGAVVICSGGGGIPMSRTPGGALEGIEAVIDKDRASALLARELAAERLVMATDVAGVYACWGTPDARMIRQAPPAALARFRFAPGSMGPKVEAARDFAEATGRAAVIGALGDLPRLVRGEAGTTVTSTAEGVQWD